MSAENGMETQGIDNAALVNPMLSKEHNALLNDITMDITIEVGKAKIKINELLHLDVGKVIALEQRADEPLNIYANDKLIARGHIICTNGQYSIRVL